MHIRTFFRSFALILINTIILFVILNMLSAFALFVWKPQKTEDIAKHSRNPLLNYYGYEALRSRFPGKSEVELNTFLNSVWGIRQNYEPFIQMRSSEIRSEYVNIAEAGYRFNGVEANPWPIDVTAFNVFVFGGSTTLGIGVADSDTVVARLEAHLQRTNERKVNVYNFGVGAFFSRQEVFYFIKLLLEGSVPDVVIFIDGLNDTAIWRGEPVHSDWYRQFRQMVDNFGRQHDAVYHLKMFIQRLPLILLAERVSQRHERPGMPLWSKELSDEVASDPNVLGDILKRYIQNVNLALELAKSRDIEALFVWQPVPFYEYPFEDAHVSSFHEIIGEHKRSDFMYPYVNEYIQNNNMPERFHWCGAAFSKADDITYIDQVHYNGHGAELLSECILSGLNKFRILD